MLNNSILCKLKVVFMKVSVYVLVEKRDWRFLMSLQYFIVKGRRVGNMQVMLVFHSKQRNGIHLSYECIHNVKTNDNDELCFEN